MQNNEALFGIKIAIGIVDPLIYVFSHCNYKEMAEFQNFEM